MTDTLPDFARSVLDQIASGEGGNSYDVIYGGRKFTSYSDHPRIRVPLRGGQYSTAAGRYQMLASTWDKEKEQLGLKDFSPENQDLAAWSLAQQTYLKKTGRDLSADAQSGKVDYSALQSQWTSLRGQAKPTAGPVAAGGATQLPQPPLAPLPPWESPLEVQHRLGFHGPTPRGGPLLPPGGGLSLYQDVAFSPVDHNPFAGSVQAVPVDHDPFATEESPK